MRNNMELAYTAYWKTESGQRFTSGRLTQEDIDEAIQRKEGCEIVDGKPTASLGHIDAAFTGAIIDRTYR